MNTQTEIIKHISSDGKQMFVNSRFVAEYFKKAHRSVLLAIRSLEVPEEFSLLNFQQSDFVTERGRVFEEYRISRDGFMLLAMGFTGKEAMKIKLSFISAFNAMESYLLKQTDTLEWKAARVQIKQTRKSFTDTVQNFVAYATEQGSSSAQRYYANLTKMEYSALQMVDWSNKVPDKFRDSLDIMDLSFLTAAEQIARRAIQKGMGDKQHYKDIYQQAKLDVVKFAEGCGLARLSDRSA